ncbi:MAG: RNA 2',3'-cyclic phosphodiesterase [Bacteroidota bacterium]
MNPPELRLFLGLSISSPVKEVIEDFLSSHSHIKGVRWVRTENLHLTVAFLGNVPHEMLQNLDSLIQVSVANQHSFELLAKDIHLGPKPNQARLVWTRFHRSPDFRNLVQAFYQNYSRVRPDFQHRYDPMPHVTLGRFNKADALQKEKFPLVFPYDLTLRVADLHLWSSSTKEGIRIYKKLNSYRLNR